MQDIHHNAITLDQIILPVSVAQNIELYVLRLDKIHPYISGNKWFKLCYYFDEAKELNKKKIVTFGGAWSNHILATAAACQLKGFDATGIIRGEEAPELSQTLKLAREMGMQLIFLSREDYKKKKLPPDIENDDTYFINEGGYGIKGAAGAATMLNAVVKKDYSHICCAAGTGTMMAGLALACGEQNKIVGISVLKNNREIEQQMKTLIPGIKINFEIIPDYHFGGYARYKPAQIQFMNEFYRLTGIPSDFIYTGKLFYAINDLIGSGYFPRGSRILIVHSGGLQGNASLGKGTLIF